MFLFDRMIDCDPDLYTAAVVSDMRNEGVTAVEWLESLGLEEYKILHIQGQLGSAAQIGRSEPLQEKCEADEKWTMVREGTGGDSWDPNEARKIAEAAINAGEDFNIVYAENDGMAQGVVAALDANGITHGVDGDVIVMGFDCNKWALRELLAGNWNYDGQCSPFQATLIDGMIKTLQDGGEIEGLNELKQIINEEKGFDARTITEEDIETYGLLKVTAAGKRFLNSPKPFSIVVELDEDEMEEEEVKGAGASAAADEELYNMLKDLRKKVAKKLELPPYVIFQDPSLEAMATTYPITIEELQNVPGVGAGKAKRYGEEFCALIKRHCDENEIVRPEDLRVRTVANKSKKKLDIIKAIDRKIALDELAQGQHMDFKELLDDLEAIIASGTHINIDYFLEDIMDKEDVDELYQYFKESPNDDLEAAVQEWGSVYTEEEIRLVRIKFIAEMAN